MKQPSSISFLRSLTKKIFGYKKKDKCCDFESMKLLDVKFPSQQKKNINKM